MNKVPLRVVGVKLREREPSSPMVPGTDFPAGIQFLDPDFFLNELNLQALATCEDLPAFREKARFVLRLLELKAKAEGGV